MTYARLPFERPSVTELRRACQPEMARDELYMFVFFRPFSVYLSRLIVERTSLSANSVTGFMAILGLLGPVAVVFSASILGICLISFFYMVLTSLLDACDGEIARMRGVTSNLGVVLDASLWFYYPLMFVIVVLKVGSELGLGMTLGSLAVVGAFHELYSVVARRYMVETHVSMKQTPLRSKTLRLVPSKSLYLVGLLPLHLFFGLYMFKRLFVLYTGAIVGLYFVNASVAFWTTFRRIP